MYAIIKGKVKLKAKKCLIKHSSMKSYSEIEAQLQMLWTSVVYGFEWSAQRNGCFNSGKWVTGADWMDPRLGTEAVAKRKLHASAKNRIPVASNQVTTLTELSRLPFEGK
jgi:hypothetical protein